MLSSYLIIGLGGAFGAMYRSWLCSILPSTIFSIPAPILCINVLGCFVMGFLNVSIALYMPSNPYIKSFLLTGFLGGFTTFSSFALEYSNLWNAQEQYAAITYALISVGLSLMFFFIGAKIANLYA